VSVTAPRGFVAAGATAGLKNSGRPDLALVVNQGPELVGAGVFTGNRCKAHPVLWSERVCADHRIKAVVLNSGGANCFAGPQGTAVVERTAEHLAAGLGCPVDEIAVCSTGLIGQTLDPDLVCSGLDGVLAALGPDGGPAAAEAIMTTDTRPKQALRTSPEGWSVAGMAKGAGMLAPGLATMLVVLTTDAQLYSTTCDKALRVATALTFDRLDSDGCMSTNDTVVLLASGASGIRPDPANFTDLLREVCHDLAMQMLGDAEGADHDIAIEVRGAACEDEALTAARAVARSNLFKCAVFGKDPNWGRILAALGTTDATFEPDRIDIAMNGYWICRDGAPGEPPDVVDLSDRAVDVTIDLHAGDATATLWTNDLTHAYIHENSAYST
jgi:glutamate N-acetyltransferase / amino-acid N-acetyltransferase